MEGALSGGPASWAPWAPPRGLTAGKMSARWEKQPLCFPCTRVSSRTPLHRIGLNSGATKKKEPCSHSSVLPRNVDEPAALKLQTGAASWGVGLHPPGHCSRNKIGEFTKELMETGCEEATEQQSFLPPLPRRRFLTWDLKSLQELSGIAHSLTLSQRIK